MNIFKNNLKKIAESGGTIFYNEITWPKIFDEFFLRKEFLRKLFGDKSLKIFEN